VSANLPAGEAHGPGAVADSPIAAELAGDGRMNRGAVAWSLFEGARNPYVVLVTIYIFAPYIASVMIGDPVKGQAVISQWSQYSGWIIMATAPFLGASID
jgi:UMF1 family MFS transporter